MAYGPPSTDSVASKRKKKVGVPRFKGGVPNLIHVVFSRWPNMNEVGPWVGKTGKARPGHIESLAHAMDPGNPGGNFLRLPHVRRQLPPQTSLLRLLCQGDEGGFSRQQPSQETTLTSLLRFPPTVADTHRANRFGDIRDTENIPLRGLKTPRDRRSLSSNTGLRESNFNLNTKGQQQKVEEISDAEEADKTKGNSPFDNSFDSPIDGEQAFDTPNIDELANTKEVPEFKFPPSPPKSSMLRASPFNTGWPPSPRVKLFDMMEDIKSAGKRSWSAMTDSLPQTKPWWTSFLASPTRRVLASGDSDTPNDWWSEDFELPETLEPNPSPRESRKPQVQKAKPRRRDLPQYKPRKTGVTKKSSSKASIARAVHLATNMQEQVVTKVEKEYYANSSAASKLSKRKLIAKIFKGAKANYPLTPEKLRLLAGSLKQANYKSAYTYVIEAKSEHVEKGHGWNALLDRHFKLCIAASKRGVGPRKKAPEVPENSWTSGSLLADSFEEGTKVGSARLLFACGVHWMLREIELASLTVEDVKLDPDLKTACLLLRQTKTDTAAHGVRRTLQCICQQPCDLRRPYAVLASLSHRAVLRGAEGGHLAMKADGEIPTKAEVVGDWQSLFGPEITGRSAKDGRPPIHQIWMGRQSSWLSGPVEELCHTGICTRSLGIHGSQLRLQVRQE